MQGAIMVLLRTLIISICLIISSVSSAAVILQYHHVSDKTPASTSISPQQFKAHMQYLVENNFTVVPLSSVVNQIVKKQEIIDKTIVITFDDAYLDILTNAKPILDEYGFPYTIFVNPAILDANRKNYLSWQQIIDLSDAGVIIANHGLTHDSLARIPDGISSKEWYEAQTEKLIKAEELIKEHTGQNWQYFAYPYGEFTPDTQKWLNELGFVGFSQQSGAVGISSDLTNLPRFPVSQPYDKLSSLRDKLNALPFHINLDEQQAKTLFVDGEISSASFGIELYDFKKTQLNCYISGLGRQKINWVGNNQVSMEFSGPLPIGRVRSNCTAPSLSKPGRFYWYSKPWFIIEKSGQWYPL